MHRVKQFNVNNNNNNNNNKTNTLFDIGNLSIK
jgi:hypothetical protein